MPILYETQFPPQLDCNTCFNGGPRVKNMAHPEWEMKAKGTHIE